MRKLNQNRKDVITGMITRMGRSVSIECDSNPIIFTHAIIGMYWDGIEERHLFIFPANSKIPKSGIGDHKMCCTSMGKIFTAKDCGRYKHRGRTLYYWMETKQQNTMNTN